LHQVIIDITSEDKKAKLAQYAERVRGLNEGTTDEKAHAAINKMETFFQSLGIETKLSKYTENYSDAAPFILQNFHQGV
jgi:NADP-dependent alcohol dehydrogenase